MNFSLILPSRNRMDLLSGCLHSFFGKAKHADQIEAWIAFDIDDPSSHQVDEFATKYGYNIRYIKVPRANQRHKDYHGRLAKLVEGKYVLGLGDDTEVVQHHWDELVANETEKYLANKPDRIAYIYLGDSTHVGSNRHAGEGSCFPMLTVEAIRASECFIPYEIEMWGGDIILFRIYNAVGRILNISDKIQILHHSPHNRTRPADELHHTNNVISHHRDLSPAQYKHYVDKLVSKFR